MPSLPRDSLKETSWRRRLVPRGQGASPLKALGSEYARALPRSTVGFRAVSVEDGERRCRTWHLGAGAGPRTFSPAVRLLGLSQTLKTWSVLT